MTGSPAAEERLVVRDLRIAFGSRRVVDLESLGLGAGEIVGLAGEYGSGKSMTAMAIHGLATQAGATVEGSNPLDGEATASSKVSARRMRGTVAT